MRSRGLLLRVPEALRRVAVRAGAAGLALLLLAPVPAAGGSAMPELAAPAQPAPPSASLPAPPGTTTLVSVRFGGGFAGGTSAEPSISANGRWVAFTSGAADLVAGDVNQAFDVFVRDRSTGTTTRLPLLKGTPVPTGGRASEPSISADGSVVAFTYQPPTPVGATVVPGTIVLAWERTTGKVEVVSRNVRGSAASGSRQPSVSGDGRYVAYTSDNNLIVTPDGNGSPDVFRYDRRTGTTVPVSTGVGGNPAGQSDSPSISGDGRYVAFVSAAGDTLVPENTGKGRQVFVRDVTAGTTQRVSVADGGGPADNEALAPSISADGRYVAFESAATNIVAGDANGASDVFRRDRQAGVTVLVSLAADGSQAGGASGQASITRDGRMVAFASTAANLTSGVVANAHLAAAAVAQTEVYIRDVDGQDTALVSTTPAGVPGGGRSLTPAVAGNGRYVAFASTSPALVAGDGNKAADVFLRDFPPVPTLNPSVVDFGTRAVGSTPVPGAAVLANTGWGPLSVSGSSVTGAARADFPITLDGCSKAVLYRGQACTVTVSFSPAKPGARTATLAVATSASAAPRTARLRGNGSKAALEIDPPIGPPGTVVVATGSGFPPGARITLKWSRGITPKLPAVFADAAGRFQVQVLVFHNDVIGARDLRAAPAGVAAFPPVAAPMLVEAPSAMPPGFVALYRFVDIPLVLVIRG